MRYIQIFFLLLFMGCHTAKQAEKSIDKVQAFHPEVMAKKSAQLYPCKATKKASDSSALIYWKKRVTDLEKRKIKTKIDTLMQCDTIVDIDTLVTDCPKLVTQYRELIKESPVIHDTFTIMDESKLTSITFQLSQQRANADEYQKKYTKSMYWIAWLLILIICLLLALKLKK
jgi:hypothetical protein